jgi:para-aminobenzoate synthetase component I
VPSSLKPWYWRSLPLLQRTGSDVFNCLFRLQSTPSIATLLESPDSDRTPQARYSICAGAPRRIDGKLQLWTPSLGQILPLLRSRLQSALPLTDYEVPSLPFTGGWLGWLGYDLAWEIERLPNHNSDPLPFPIAYWYEPECFAVLDHWEQTLWLAVSHPQQLDQLEQQLTADYKSGDRGSIRFSAQAGSGSHQFAVPQFQTTQAEYEAAVRRAKQHIQAGDIFQANLSLRFETRTSADSWSIYQALHHINPSPFASYWQTPWGAIASCSPERLVSLHNQHAQTRPIAGTRPRGITPEQDQRYAQELLANVKENAEHIMLVDLERNDLGRVCTWGSVKVNELLAIERYSHVMHLVSNVQGSLSPDYDAVDVIRALFPGGTITGCPKIRCMEIIEELEPVRRNLFYGSCGYLDWRGNLDLNILIRTLLCSTAQSPSNTTEPRPVWGQVGAGIVADSDPEREWHESLQKAKAQLLAIHLAHPATTASNRI